MNGLERRSVFPLRPWGQRSCPSRWVLRERERFLGRWFSGFLNQKGSWKNRVRLDNSKETVWLWFLMEGVYEEIGWVRHLEMLGEGFNSMWVGGTVDISGWGRVLVKAMTGEGESWIREMAVETKRGETPNVLQWISRTCSPHLWVQKVQKDDQKVLMLDEPVNGTLLPL